MKKGDYIYQTFVTECERAFGFLVVDDGFSPPEIYLDGEINFLTISYCKNEIAVECILDERENDVSVKISKLVDRKKPNVYRANNGSEVCREYLTQLLIRRGVRDIRFDLSNDEKLPSQQYHFRKALFGYARLLREHGKDILSGSGKIFTECKPRK